jgi:hypothetical protein
MLRNQKTVRKVFGVLAVVMVLAMLVLTLGSAVIK